MRALDTVSFTVTAPGAAGTAMTAVVGDSAVVRNSVLGSVTRIVALWTKAQAVGSSQVTFPSGNDQTRNIHMFPLGVGTSVQPQELLSLVQAGSAVVGDVELVHALIMYEDLPGVSAMLIDSSELQSRFVRQVTVEDTVTPTVASTYSGARSIQAASNLLRANTQYAVLGASIGIACGALTIRGVDTGNLRIGIPGQALSNQLGVNWFTNLADWFGAPMIPTFNSANGAGVFTEVVQDENLVAVPFAWHLAELTQ